MAEGWTTLAAARGPSPLCVGSDDPAVRVLEPTCEREHSWNVQKHDSSFAVTAEQGLFAMRQHQQ